MGRACNKIKTAGLTAASAMHSSSAKFIKPNNFELLLLAHSRILIFIHPIPTPTIAQTAHAPPAML
jgi:hypothetical protein